MISWRELLVTDNQGVTFGTLGGVVDDAPANLDDAIIVDGRITEWPDFFISATGEEPDHSTPQVAVDWTGFEKSLSLHRGSDSD